MDLRTVMHTSVLGNDLLTWAIAVAVAIAAGLVLRGVRGLLRRRLPAMAKRTRAAFDDVLVETLAATRTFTYLAVGAYAGSLVLGLEDKVRLLVDRAFVILLLVQLALWGNRALAASLERYRADEGLDSGRRTTLAAVGFLGRMVLFALVLFMALENVGVHVTTLIAGLGITSLAVALALQNILSDLFASLSIVFDKPFEIGDFIIVGDQMGSVEHVGLRTTRVRSLSGEQLVFPNNDLLTSRIRNFKRMRERRIVFAVGVTYDTPAALVQDIPGLIRAAVEAQHPVRFDRSHFKAFGAYSLDFETVYYVLDPDYNLYMDIQQAINLALMHDFEGRGIEFAFPTQTIHFAGRAAEDVGADAATPSHA